MDIGLAIVAFLGTFLLMEPVTALIHRAVMHGFGWGWHRDHHNPRYSGLERNDRFPLVFAVVAIGVLCLGVFVPGLTLFVPVGIGITAYGACYAVVHELAIHRRLGPLRPRGRWMNYLADRHAVHHKTNGAPYGMLWPVLARTEATRELSRSR